jgi:hypothetical protein
MFEVEYDRRNTIIRISVRGFWTPEDVPMLAAAIDAKVREARAVGDDFDVIVESLEFPVQANNVADLLSGIMRSGMAMTSGHAAVVVGSLLNKAQAERTLVHPRLKVFESVAEAQSWLSGMKRGGDTGSAR